MTSLRGLPQWAQTRASPSQLRPRSTQEARLQEAHYRGGGQGATAAPARLVRLGSELLPGGHSAVQAQNRATRSDQ